MQKTGVLFLAFLFTISICCAQEWKTYVNKRFGYSFEYPASFKLHEDTDSKSGVEFYEPEKENLEERKFQVGASAGFVAPDYSLQSEWTDINVENTLQKRQVIRKEKQDDSYTFVTLEKGNVFYEKKCIKGRNWASLEIMYPLEEREKYEPLVNRIEASFVPFLAGDYDRTPPNLEGNETLYSVAISPDGKYEVSHMPAPGTDGWRDQIVCISSRKTGKILYKWRSAWRYTVAFWNETSNLVAINDCIANSGDYLYVLKISDDSAKLLRKPESDSLLDRTFPNAFPKGAEGREYINALKWLTPHKLLVGVKIQHIPGYKTEYKEVVLKY